MIAAEPESRHTAPPPAAGREGASPASDLPDWQQQLARAVRDPVELLALLGLSPADLGADVTAERLRQAAAGFALRVPHAFVSRMRRGDPHDPLLRQVLAIPQELQPVPGFVADPLEETRMREAPGLLQKYSGRALLVTTGACAVHCRYCFRRHYDYGADQDSEQPRWNAALERFAADPSLDEAILSGGDPLSLGNARLGQLLDRLATLPQLARIRIHTRTPVVLPARVDEGLLALLAPWGDRLVVVVHANHPAEIDGSVTDALRRLAATGATLLNQSVLLAGVNDDAEALAGLSHRLFAARTLPYYLHQLDPVAGAAHFQVGDERAIALHRQLIGTLPGYLVPRLVREIPGADGKTPVVGL